MHEIVSSAAKAELGMVFHNGKDGCLICIFLEELGHSKPLAPLKPMILLPMESPMMLSNRNV
jgi:hypothetical protein